MSSNVVIATVMKLLNVSMSNELHAATPSEQIHLSRQNLIPSPKSPQRMTHKPTLRTILLTFGFVIGSSSHGTLLR